MSGKKPLLFLGAIAAAVVIGTLWFSGNEATTDGSGTQEGTGAGEGNCAQAKAVERGAAQAKAAGRDGEASRKLAVNLPLDEDKPVELVICPKDDIAAKTVRERVEQLGGSVIETLGGEDGARIRLKVALKGTSIIELAEEEAVGWIERAPHYVLLNDVAVGPEEMNVRTAWNVHGLTGDGQIISTSDSGVDTGNKSTVHLDLRSNILDIKRPSYNTHTYDMTGHGTHTAGSLVGDGAMSDGKIKGVAYGAKLFVWCCETAAGGLLMPSTPEQLFRGTGLTSSNKPRIHSASWGDNANTNIYTSECQDIDDYLWKNPDMLAVFSAGNAGAGNRTLTAQATAKNVLTVGATENYRPESKFAYPSRYVNRIASYSSRGPTRDGRVKPDIVAPGTMVLSTLSTRLAEALEDYEVYDDNSSYCFCSGTSMSCPLVAGSAALVREWLVKRRSMATASVSSALVKAVLTGGATDLKGRTMSNVYTAAPTTTQGWGRIDLTGSLYPTNGLAVWVRDRIPFSQGSEWTLEAETTKTAPLAVQLAWVDYKGNPADDGMLVNDLDLVVSNCTSGAVWTPNDHSNNVEGVRIASAEAGKYVVFVRGNSVPHASTEGGAAGLYLKGAVEPEEDDIRTPVKLTVAREGEIEGVCSMEYGEHEVASNSTVTISAEQYHYLTSSTTGFEHTRYRLRGETNVVSVVMDGDKTVTWSWDEQQPEYRFVAQLYLYGYGDPYGYKQVVDRYYDEPYLLRDEWYVTNTVINLELPGDLAYDPFCRSNGYHSTDDWHTRTYGDWTYRFAMASYVRLEDGTMTPLYDGDGHWSTSVDITFDEGCSMELEYFEEKDRIATHPLFNIEMPTWAPTWWMTRNLLCMVWNEIDVSDDGDLDEDGFTNLEEYRVDTDPLDAESRLEMSITPTSVCWKAGAEVSQVLETRARLGGDGAWTPVMTNDTGATEMEFQINNSGDSGYYRINVPEGMQR